MALCEDDARTSAEVRRIARRHLDEIEDKIADLKAVRDPLTHLVDTCAGDDRPDCPILADLSGERPAR